MLLARLRGGLSPRGAGFVVYALISVAAALCAYWLVYSLFPPYDDEGTLLADLQAFVSGDVAYRDVYSQYGPFYFELFGGFFALTGKTISTDVGRAIVVAIWTSASLLFGIAAHRLTGRLALGAAATAVAFRPLGGLVGEPMHPIGLCLFLLALICLLAAWVPGGRPRLHAVLFGATLAALTLTKINLGAFAIAALALAAVLTQPELRRVRLLRWAVLAGFVLMPLALMRADLDKEWVRDLLLAATCSAAAVAVAAHSVEATPDEGGAGRRWLIFFGTAFVGACVLIIGGILATGTTFGDLYDGMIREAARGREVFVIPFQMQADDAIWAIGALAAAVVAAPWLKRPTLASGAVRLSAGLLTWLLLGKLSVLGIGTDGSSPVLPMVLAWIVAVPPFAEAEPRALRSARIFLPALAVAEALQVYPVAGSQVAAANVCFVTVGALGIADGLRILAALDRPVASERALRLATYAFAAAAIWMVIVRQEISAAVQYSKTPPLRLGGATWVHIPRDQASTYERLVALIEDHCTQFVSYPAINSLYIWTHIRPPHQTLPGGWMTLIDDRRQAKVVRELEASPRPCVIRNDAIAANWINGQPDPKPVDGPLVDYINGFQLSERVGEYQFMLPGPG